MGLFSGDDFEGLFFWLEAHPVLGQHQSLTTWAEELYFSGLWVGQPPLVVYDDISVGLDQVWHLPIGAGLLQGWRPAPIVGAGLLQWWRTAYVLHAMLQQEWSQSLSLSAGILQQWYSADTIGNGILQPWAICSGEIGAGLVQSWEITGL